MMKKLSSGIALGIGLVVIPVTAAWAQVGGLGDAASEAVKKRVVEGVEVRSGLGTPVATVVTSPTAAGSPTAVSPSAAASPAAPASPMNGASPGSAAAASPAPAEDGMGRMLMDQAGKKATDEATKRMGPKLP